MINEYLLGAGYYPAKLTKLLGVGIKSRRNGRTDGYAGSAKIGGYKRRVLFYHVPFCWEIGRKGNKLRITFTMAGDFSVGEFVGVVDNELAICHPCCGFCEEAKEVVTGEVAVGVVGVCLEELGKDLVVAEEDFGRELHGVDTAITR